MYLYLSEHTTVVCMVWRLLETRRNGQKTLYLFKLRFLFIAALRYTCKISLFLLWTTSLLWYVAQGGFVFNYRRFGTTYPPHPKCIAWTLKMRPISCAEASVTTSNDSSATYQTSEYLTPRRKLMNYFVSEPRLMRDARASCEKKGGGVGVRRRLAFCCLFLLYMLLFHSRWHGKCLWTLKVSWISSHCLSSISLSNWSSVFIFTLLENVRRVLTNTVNQ